MNKILFSPIGDSDPVRKFHDGACLHIVRYYAPELVVLFLTREMAERECRDHRYTRCIAACAPKTEIRTIETDIRSAQRYDSFIEVLPRAVRELHEEHPEATVLLNLSSGTPQLKTALAILSVEAGAWCRGIQVDSPEAGSNHANREIEDVDVETLLETDLDHEPGSTTMNRCSEPPIRLLQYYAEKNRILGLVDRYEYEGALSLARDSGNLPGIVCQLLEHAALRMKLLAHQAEARCSKYQGEKLFLFMEDKGKQSLLEYFMLMQIDSRKGNYASFVLKLTPFLYTLLLEYVRNCTNFPLEDVCCLAKRQNYALRRDKLQQCVPGLLENLDRTFHKGYRDSDLSFLLLCHICVFVQEQQWAKNAAVHESLLKYIEPLKGFTSARNDAAHIICNLTREEFVHQIHMEPEELLNQLVKLLGLLYGGEVRVQLSIYDRLNDWIRDELNQGAI